MVKLFMWKFYHLGYLQLALWGWDHLGHYRCVVLPSCAVNKIRDVLPPDKFTGHQILVSVLMPFLAISICIGKTQTANTNQYFYVII